jgi:DNA-binding PadR family transcriptional regulator
LVKENPKTLTILTIIAEQGAKTEYELYKEKQLEKLSRGTIHFCLNKLYKELLLTIVTEEGPRIKKKHHLTFRGARIPKLFQP